MSYVIKTVLSNARHPENGQVTIPFPIPNQEYDRVLEQLETLEIGDAIRQDCQVEELDAFYSVLNRLIGKEVNLDELDYLAKRLDSFDNGETEQFQAMAYKLNLTDIKDFINLTFCCQQATVISKFSDLEAVGRAHYMNLNGGSASTEELKNLDAFETALLLIDSGAGAVTPYGVVYDNGMRLEQTYDGRYFPEYLYENSLLVLELSAQSEPYDQACPSWLYLPMPYTQIQRAMIRAGISSPEDSRLKLVESQLPQKISEIIDIRRDSLNCLNKLCRAMAPLNPDEVKKLEAVVLIAKPETAVEVCQMAENLDQFDFVPNVQTPEEYGRYMIQESGHFEYDEHLEDFYDYRLYGEQRVEAEGGQFNEYGYVAYHGTMALEELTRADPAEQYQREQGPQMGGLS